MCLTVLTPLLSHTILEYQIEFPYRTQRSYLKTGYCLNVSSRSQTNRLKHQKPGEREFYEAIRERHSVRAASRFSLKVLRVDSDLCELK
mgnify:CR=1 FL=1